MSKYKGKKVLVVGFGLSGVAVARYMCRQGARVMVTDIKTRTDLNDFIAEVQDLKIEYDLGKHTNRFFHTADLIVVSPGVPLNIKPLEEAREHGVAITSEIELGCSALKEPLVAVTGTNGKTTTSTLIAEMFKEDERSVFLGGNIGRPLLNYITQKDRADMVVAELSSFQLNLCERMVPAVAVFTNISQDHLDRYPDMESYIEAKKKLLKACDRNSYVVLNYDDPYISRFGTEGPGKKVWYTKRNPMEIGGEFAEDFVGCYLDAPENRVMGKFTGKEESYDISKLRIFGDHNRENLMAAICAARVTGARPKAVQQVIDAFEGVPHRLEFVKRKNGVFFINDSKSTNAASLERSLLAFKKSPIVLIAGGKDKDLDFSPLADLVRRRCKTVILLGEAKEKMNRAIGDFAETYLVGTFEEAILLAYQKSRTGDIILLSPGCSSQDMFRNFEERGDYFKKLVNQL